MFKHNKEKKTADNNKIKKIRQQESNKKSNDK